MIRPFSIFLTGLAIMGHGWLAPPQATAQSVEIVTTDKKLQSALARQLDDTDPAETVFEARRQAERAARTLGDYLNSQAYFAAELTPSVTEDTPVRGQVTIVPGPKFTISAMRMELLNGTLPEEVDSMLSAQMSREAGQTARPDRIIAAERSLLSALRAQGYAYGEIGPREVLADRDTSTVEITLRMRPGPRIIIGQTRVAPGVRTRQAHLQRLAPFEPGAYFAPEQLSAFTNRLSETRHFTDIRTQLAETPSGRTAAGEEIRDVIVSATERKSNTLSIGGNFSTSEGFGANLAWTVRNPTRRGDTLVLSTTLAELRRSGEAEWRWPNAFGYQRGFAFNGAFGRDETDAFDREFVSLAGALDFRQSSNISYIVGTSAEFSNETDVAEERSLGIVSASLAARLDYADNLLDPTEGWRLEARIEPGIVFGEENAQYFLSTAQASAYQPLDQDRAWVLAARVRAGSAAGASTLDLPASRRFFAGGGGSARGFDFQSVGPEDEDGQPIGGRGLFEAAGEVRWRISRQFGLTAFVDTASVSLGATPSFSDLSYGAGIGLRYFTDIGPLRLDIATPINPEPDDADIQVYISLGQAF